MFFGKNTKSLTFYRGLTPGMLETTSKVTPQPGMVLRVDILLRKLWAKPWRPGLTLTQILFLSTSCMSAGWLSWTTTRTVRYTRCSGHAPPRLSWGHSWTVESHDASAFTCRVGQTQPVTETIPKTDSRNSSEKKLMQVHPHLSIIVFDDL